MADRRVARRMFLFGLAGSGAAAVVGMRAATGAGDAPTGTYVWRLDSAWGYPVGPKAKTHCECNACRRHAANKVFATAPAATAGRIHPCCVCQPRAVPIDPAGWGLLFPPGVTAVDLRHPGVAQAYGSIVLVPGA